MNADAEQSDGPEWIIIFIFDPTIIMMGLFSCGPVLVLYGPSGLQKNLKEGCILGGSGGRPAEKKTWAANGQKTENGINSAETYVEVPKFSEKLQS